jgi:hypothetical protein
MRFSHFLVVIATCVFVSNAYSTRYYVNSFATGNQNGLSWTNAYTDLQTALSLVVFGDEIWVAAGQYKPTTTTTRTISFVLKNGVNLYGGFAGTESNLEERDIANNPTSLNGDIGQLGEVSDNSYNVIRGTNITSTIVLDGFRIINGNSSSGNQQGGGLHYTNSLNGQIIIRNCLFFSNRAQSYGGAIYLRGSKMKIENCEFRNNTTNGGNGGAIYTLNDNANSTLIVKDSKFLGNVSRIGACLANTSDYNEILLERCLFTNNESDISIIEINGFNKAKIVNSYIIGNTVDDFSPKLMYVSNSFGDATDDFELLNCTIANNYNITTSTVQSEMIKLIGATLKVRNSIIYGNSSYQGRQIKLGNSVSNCLIEGGYTGGTNIINANPQFVNANSVTNTNFEATSFNYSLHVSSPAINAGMNDFLSISDSLDLNSSARIQGCIVDLGCFESGIAHTFYQTSVVSACDSYTWIDGNTYTESTEIPTFTFQSALGCDSIVTLNLSINHSSSGTDEISTCGTYTWIDGITYTESNQTATFIVPNSAGCDSIITLNLTIDSINLPSFGTDIITSCESYTWINGITYTSNNNSATFVLSNAGGCDSTVTLNLTITQNTSATQTVSACGSYTWINGITYTASTNSAQHILQNANGCDSVITLNLTILNPILNTSLNVNQATLTSNAQNATFQWLNCETNLPISGETNSSFTATTNGNYAVILTSTICPEISDTSICQQINLVGLNDIKQNKIQVFPNPSHDFVFIESEFNLNSITLIDILGKTIERKIPNSKSTYFDMKTLEKGVYTIETRDEVNGLRIFKIVKD